MPYQNNPYESLPYKFLIFFELIKLKWFIFLSKEGTKDKVIAFLIKGS